jgi:signal transduction histidine kinase
MKIAKKLILSFIAVGLLVGFTGYVAIYFAESALEKNIIEGSDLLSKEILTSIEKNIYIRIIESQELADDPRVKNAIRISNEEFENIEHLEKYIEEKDVDWASGTFEEKEILVKNLIDHENSKILKNKINFYEGKYGHLVFAEIFTTNKYGANVAQSSITSDYKQSDEEWWQIAANEGFHINDVEYDQSAGVYSVDISMRINDDDGNFLGVMKSVVNLDDVLSSIQEAKLASNHPSIYFDLINSNNQIIYSTQQNWKIFEDISSKSYFHSLIEETKGHSVIKENDFMEIGEIYSFARSEGYRDFAGLDWILVIGYDAQDVLSSVSSLKITIVVISILIGIVAVGFGLIISRSIVIPIREVIKSTQVISKGEYLGHLKIRGNDEIAILTKSFNSMSDSLQRSIRHGKNLEEVDNSKNEFMAMITHELRSPLTPIIGWCDALKNPTILGKLDDKQSKAVNTILNNALNLQSLISDLLDAQKLEMGKMKFDKSKFSVSELMDRVVNNFEHTVKVKNIVLINLTKDEITLTSDEKRIEQVLTNLINNSVDFVQKETGKIEISCKEENDSLFFEVRDNGPGIEEEKQKLLFKKFYQADTSLRREHGGTGLGLSICKGIIEGLGGEIFVNSVLGGGTSFHFILPKK